VPADPVTGVNRPIAIGRAVFAGPGTSRTCSVRNPTTNPFNTYVANSPVLELHFAGGASLEIRVVLVRARMTLESNVIG
jgi:hypothetical protein